MPTVIRRAVPAEPPFLNELTKRSVLFWGYEPEFFNLVGRYRCSGSACRAPRRMKVHDEQVIQAERCRVAYSAGIAWTDKSIS
jgi:hypothetical protein